MERSDATMFVATDWIERHCVIPDGFRKGEPFRLYAYQLDYLAAFYTVRGEAQWMPDNPVRSAAFVYRRGILVGPQKLGKNPMIAAQVCLEGVGPALFAGWAGKDDGYACRDHGCRCGWEWPYQPGDPMGMAWPTPLIQITAYSEDSTENTYDALRPMIELGPLADLIPKTGEEFIRLPGGGRIDTVTSSALARLGQRLTFAPQDEVGIYTKRNGMAKVADTQWRGLAGMGGRASLTSNSWDPAEGSVGQQEYESVAVDVYRQFVHPPKNLSYGNKAERRKIHRVVYPPETLRENGGHIDLEAIEAEAADIAERDLPQASRFFGNMLVTGAGRAFDVDAFKALRVKRPKVVPDGTLITIGIDGSIIWDATAVIATEVITGYQWPLGIWERPLTAGPLASDWGVPFDQVDATINDAFKRWDVWRMYGDPPYIESWLATWSGRYGEKRVIEWFTARPKSMAYALRAWASAQAQGELSHCAESDTHCAAFTRHVGNAVRRPTGYRDDAGDLWTVEKDRSGSPNKIDSVPAACLSWEARNDAIAAGATTVVPFVSVYAARGVEVFG